MAKINSRVKILKDYSENGITLTKGSIIKVIDAEEEFIKLEGSNCKWNKKYFIEQGYFMILPAEEINDSTTQEKIQTLFSNFKDFLQEKNKRYGDSVINPVKVFSKVEPENKACIRLDEKLQRIINSDELRKNDVSDTFGYLALLMIDKGWLTFEEMLD